MNKKIFPSLVLIWALIFIQCHDRNTGLIDTLILHAKIWSDGAWLQEDAIAIKEGKISSVAMSSELQKSKAQHTIDAQGKYLMPGFIDAHVHFIMGGENLLSIKILDVHSRQEFINRIKEYALLLPKGQWITGGLWNHENWGGELPERFWIDSVTPYHPLVLGRMDGHMILANSLAMDAAGVTNKVKDVMGGAIPRNNKGEVIGIFKDNAADLIYKSVPPPTKEQEDQRLKAAMEYVASKGVTKVHHMGTFEDLEVFRRNKSRLITRIYAATPLANWNALDDYIQAHGHGDQMLHWGLLKGFMDGSLGSHTAAMHSDFADKKGDKGFLINHLDSMQAWIRNADNKQLQVAVHAIGDKAISDLIDIFREIYNEHGARDRRWRIEHFQHPMKGDIERMGPLGIVASMQPYHAIDDGVWAERVLGKERIQTTYAFRSVLDQSIHLAFGSDWFVAPPDPILGMDAAVNRRTLDDKNPAGWVPTQKINALEAYNAYSKGGAYAAFDEDHLGQIKTGYLADLILVDQNILSISNDSLKYSKVLWTMVDGKIVYHRR